jgi:hypothetical protein
MLVFCQGRCRPMRRRTHSEYEIQRASLCRGSEVILSFSDSCPQRWQEHVPDGKKPPVIPYHPKPSILNNAERKKDAQMITIRLAQVIPSAARLRPPTRIAFWRARRPRTFSGTARLLHSLPLTHPGSHRLRPVLCQRSSSVTHHKPRTSYQEPS